MQMNYTSDLSIFVLLGSSCHMFQWKCPSSGSPLTRLESCWRSAHNQTFDIAKEGYVNLLLVQHKNSKAPGDSKPMVNARRMFLESGGYAPLVQAIRDTLVTHNSNSNGALAIFDAGCGEGYYLNKVIKAFSAQQLEITACGVDISKPAIQKAAKRYKSTQFAVASTFAIPLADATQDIAIQVFAPSSSDEILRVLKPQGLWLTVSPAPDHLFELKQKVYDQPQKHTANSLQYEGFEMLARERVTFSVSLSDANMREALLMMTPFYWQISIAKKDALKASLKHVTADFDLQLWRKPLA